MKLSIVVAVAENGVIGGDGTLLWHYPEDLKHFKETTEGHAVIMGRVTYEDIHETLGSPLPNRENIVLTSNSDLSGDPHIANSLEDSVRLADELGESKAYIIGGETVYEQFLDRDIVDELIVTEVPGEYDGSATFPSWDENSWTETRRRELGDDGLEVVRYEP